MVSLILMRKVLILVLLAVLPLPVLAGEKSSSIVDFLKGYRSEVRGQYDEAMEQYRSTLRG